MPALDQVLFNAKIYVDGIDFSTDSSAIAISASRAQVDSTRLNNGGTKTYLAGEKDIAASFVGFSQIGLNLSDAAMFAKIAQVDAPTMVVADPGSAGSVSYLYKALNSKYESDGAVGEALKFSIDQKISSGGVRRGTLLVDSNTTKTVTGVSTAIQVGAVTALQKVYCQLQVLSVAGTVTPTFTAKVQSDNAVGFPSSFDVATFAAKTAIGSEWVEVAGPNTDDWWRLSWTITGTNPIFTVACAIAIVTP